MAEIKVACGICGGDGIDWRETDAQGGHGCKHCDGTGTLSAGDIPKLDELETKVDNLTDTVNDVMDKCNDIMDKCNEIKAVVDVL